MRQKYYITIHSKKNVYIFETDSLLPTLSLIAVCWAHSKIYEIFKVKTKWVSEQRKTVSKS